MRALSTTAVRALATTALAAGLVLPACRLVHRPRTEEPPPRVELNSAPLKQIERLPGITPSMARRIVAERPYDDPDDLVARGILTRRELERISERITVRRSEH